MALDLQDKRVLVVGAGAYVLAAGRPGPKLDAIAAEVGGKAVAFDILDNAAIEAFFARTTAFDHVVIAAAATKAGSVAGLSLDEAKASLDSKFWAAYRVARAAKVADGGSITFVSGFLAHRPSATAVVQGAINAAIEALGRGLALERAPVRINTVSPGVIDTPL